VLKGIWLCPFCFVSCFILPTFFQNMFLSSRVCWCCRTSRCTWAWWPPGSKGRWWSTRTPRSAWASRSEGSARVWRLAWGDRKQRNDRWITHVCHYLFWTSLFSFTSSVILISVRESLPSDCPFLLGLLRNFLYRPECSSVWSQTSVNKSFSFWQV
jgi:hypothetical protein